MTNSYFYVDFKRRTIKKFRIAANYGIHETTIVVYRGKEKIYVSGYYKDRRTFYETEEQALQSLINFCKSKIEKCQNKANKWAVRLDDIKETYTDHGFLKS